MRSDTKKRKKVYILLLAFILGIVVGGGIQYKRLTKSNSIEYRSDFPIKVTISEQEMAAKEALTKLFTEYGQIDPESTVLTGQEIPKNQLKRVEALFTKGNSATYCKKTGEDIEVYYELDGICYHLLYVGDHIQKGITLNYNDEEYSIVNMDNKEFDCTPIN